MSPAKDMKTLNMDWPWRELNELSDELAHDLCDGVRRIMINAGEDPDNQALFALRCRQVVWGVKEGRPL